MHWNLGDTERVGPERGGLPAIHLRLDTVSSKLGFFIQAEPEASPAGGGGWAGAREACTAASDGGGGSLSVVRCTEVILILWSWVGLLACSLIRANLNWRAALSGCHGLVTGAVGTRRLAPRCALPWEYEAPDSRRSCDSCVAALGCPCEPGQLCCCTSTCGVGSDVVAP